jgi:fatty-acid desaturase
MNKQRKGQASEFTPGFLLGSVLLIFLLFCVVLLCVLRSEFRVVMSVTIACLIYVIYACLSIAVSNTYHAVFLFCFSSSCVPYAYVASFSELFICDCPFGTLLFTYKILHRKIKIEQREPH